jgi:hypothetical protein
VAKRATTQKLDLYAKFAAEYAAKKTPALVEISPAQYLAVSGRGEPGSELFQSKIGALYNVAFTVKMARKFAGRDYAVSKLEGLWWGSGNGSFLNEPSKSWNWTLLIRTPDFITRDEVKSAIDKLLRKGKPADVRDVRLDPLEEGRCVQMLHVGPYDLEEQTLAKMHAFADAQGVVVHGRHHEVYLSDPLRVDPAKLRTILRLPVRRKRR